MITKSITGNQCGYQTALLLHLILVILGYFIARHKYTKATDISKQAGTERGNM